VYQSVQDAAGITRCYLYLVGIELSRNNLKTARKYMRLAEEAFTHSPGMDSLRLLSIRSGLSAFTALPS
jgi:hypothetical protein